MFLNCPKDENLFAFVSIPQEVSLWKRSGVRLHIKSCQPCREKVTSLRSQWDAYFAPEPDITSSLMSVYSRLQNDETLILKGWKLSPARPHRKTGLSNAQKSWLFGGGFSVALASFFVLFTLTGLKLGKATSPVVAGAGGPGGTALSDVKVPLAQIRFEDENRVKVEYVQPQLLQSIEFETSAR
jgi:hypothetical protein